MRFFDLAPEDSDPGASRVVTLPVPFERTTSYGQGTADGPRALLAASQQVELYDEELRTEPYRLGIATLPPCEPASHDLAEAIAEIEAAATPHLRAGKFLVTVGGEHSLTLGPARAAARVHGDSDPMGVLQFDAHADLRDSYEGTRFSHACVMRRLLEAGFPIGAVGLRALSKEEGTLIEERRLPVIWGWQLDDCEAAFEELLDALPERLYLTFDVDFFDPALLPATGTPEPGGGRWWPTLRLLRRLFERKQVVAMDIVELAPRPGHPASDFVAARLLYKCLAYLQRGEQLRGSGEP